jgi:2-polyprenyl-3-methyl-5-hydroxy-6-metoxy-1,4-benzoquinol methylase
MGVNSRDTYFTADNMDGGLCVYYASADVLRTMMIEMITCPACSEPQRQFLFATDRYSLVQCRGCGLIYKSLAGESTWGSLLENLYNGDFIRQRSWAKKRLCQVANRRLDLLRPYLPAGGRILEIGCGTGEFLAAARGQGYQPEAVEFAPAVCTWIQNSLKLPCYCGTVSQLPATDVNYDAVVAFDVLEHQTNAAAFVRQAADRLKPTGVLFLEMPHWNCMEHQVFGHLWNMVNIADHFLFFSEANWRQLARRTGLNTIVFQTHEAYWEWMYALIFAILNVGRIRRFGQPRTHYGDTAGGQVAIGSDNWRSIGRRFAAQELPARMAWLIQPLLWELFHYARRRNLGTEMAVIAQKTGA